MVTHMPWDRNFGGPRVQLELAEELERLGCAVEKFDIDDAFGRNGVDRWMARFGSNFPARASGFIQRNARRFDIIDAHQFNVPYEKRDLGFDGLLVARSVGLLPLYLDFMQTVDGRWPGLDQAMNSGIVSRLDQARLRRQFARSILAADLVNVPNLHEQQWLNERYQGKPAVSIPFGLSDQRREAFARARASARERLERPTVASVAAWHIRKGLRDWPQIVKQLRALVPDVRFLFLGTGVARDSVLRDLGVGECDWIEVIPGFASEQLPSLLARATVGAFPSHLDGFGYGVIEMLASGLPTVTYDIPGPGDIVKAIDQTWCVPVGESRTFARRLAAFLDLDEARYAATSAACLRELDRYSLERIARQTLETYVEALRLVRQGD